MLAEAGYINPVGGYKGAGPILGFMVTDYGFDEYAKDYLPGYESILRQVGFELANHNKGDSEDIANALEQPQAIVEHILMLFEDKGFIALPSFTRRRGGRTQIIEIRTRLKRWLAETS